MSNGNKPLCFRPYELRGELEARAVSVAEHDVRPNLGRVIRQLLRAGLSGQPDQEPRLSGSLEALRRDLAKVGGNLNQIARAFNMKDTLDEDALGAAHEQLRELFGQVMTTLRQVQDGLDRRTR